MESCEGDGVIENFTQAGAKRRQNYEHILPLLPETGGGVVLAGVGGTLWVSVWNLLKAGV